MKTFAPIVAFTSLFISASHAEPLDVFRDCDVCPEMIELPMGSFIMGAPPDEFRRNIVWRDGGFHRATKEHPHVKTDEGPQHTVTIDIPIAMGKNEITYDEWMACVNDGGCGKFADTGIRVGGGGPRIGRKGNVEDIMRSLTDERFIHTPSEAAMARAMAGNKFLPLSGTYPMFYVSNLDAQAYTDWLNQKLGIDAYRLPSEAEWEYGARAGTTTRFAQGDELPPSQANFSGFGTEVMLAQKRPDLRTRGFPVPVAELDAANPWGLRHMSGNAGEITLSCYTKRYAGWSTTSEWLEKSFGESCRRAVRGGGYAGPMDTARVAWRGAYDETYQTSFYGFRVVKELNETLKN